MAEVRVIARAVGQEGKESQLRELLRGVLVPTRTEHGRRSYELYERFYFYENGNAKLHSTHAASPHFKHLEKTLERLVAEPFEVNILTSFQIGKGTL